jgi:hypothetical protein
LALVNKMGRLDQEVETQNINPSNKSYRLLNKFNHLIIFLKSSSGHFFLNFSLDTTYTAKVQKYKEVVEEIKESKDERFHFFPPPKVP